MAGDGEEQNQRKSYKEGHGCLASDPQRGVRALQGQGEDPPQDGSPHEDEGEDSQVGGRLGQIRQGHRQHPALGFLPEEREEQKQQGTQIQQAEGSVAKGAGGAGLFLLGGGHQLLPRQKSVHRHAVVGGQRLE